MEDAVVSYGEEVAVKQKEVDRLKGNAGILAVQKLDILTPHVDLVERTESLSLAALEHKKQSRMYISLAFLQSYLQGGSAALYKALIQQNDALKALDRERQKLIAREKQLADILHNLRSGYNPNYQDMAVLEAVRGYEYYANLPHINDVKKDEPVTEAELGSDEAEAEEAAEEGWTVEDLEQELPGLLRSDYESLLIEHEKHIGTPATSTESLRKCSVVLVYCRDAYMPLSSTSANISLMP